MKVSPDLDTAMVELSQSTKAVMKDRHDEAEAIMEDCLNKIKNDVIIDSLLSDFEHMLDSQKKK